MTYRMRNILIAVALAGFAALLVTFYVSNYKSSVQHGQATVAVPVASHDIPQGTLGADVVAKGWLTTKEIPRNAVVPGAISSPDQIRSLVATQATYIGEQVTAARFGPTTQAGIPGQITGTQRAVQLSGSPDQVLAGTLQPGDHVDFEGVTTVQFGTGSSAITFSRIVVRDLKVLQTQAGSSSGKIGGGTGLSSIMLRMTDAQSQKIALVYALGRQASNAYWTLEARPGLKAQDSPNSVETGFTLLTDGIAAATIHAALGVAVVAAATGGH
jgi:Flp pilus assembly protein CpaB